MVRLGRKKPVFGVGIAGTIPAQLKSDTPVTPDGVLYWALMNFVMPSLTGGIFNFKSENYHVCKRRNEDDEGQRRQVR